MCGIYGYIGDNGNAAETICNGLKLLEYRGYDSWGIAVKYQISNTKYQIKVEKNVGKIGDAKVNLPRSNMGIGHTRWATHGGVTKENSHPHLDCTSKIAVVHNGIIENFQELREELVKKGHKFISGTDTEVFPHLIEEFLKKENFETSFRLAFKSLKGLNALVAMDLNTNSLAASKNGSPLIVGVKNKDLFISSDPAGIAVHTDKALYLKDDETIYLGNGLKLILSGGESVKKLNFEKLEKGSRDEDLGKYRHFMLKEIYEQPKVLENISQNYDKDIQALSKLIENAFGTFFIGAGTAYFAALMGTYLFSNISKVHVNHAPASEFNYLEDFLTKKSLIIALSQSGETIDIIEPLKRAKDVKGSRIVAITNVKGSTIYRLSDFHLLLNAGSEKAVASTKAYIAKLGILLLISYALSGNIKYGKKIVHNTSLEVNRILKKGSLENIKKIASFLNTKEHIFILGRGPSYPSALEAALKIREVSYIHAEGLAGGELKHGPIALITKGTPCIVFAPNDETYQAVMSNAMEVKARGAKLIGISYKNNEIFDYFIKVSDIGAGTLVAQIVPAQLMAYFLAVLKNLDPDKPRNLAKSVTVR